MHVVIYVYCLQRFAAAAPAVSGLYRPLNVIAPAGKQQSGSQTHPVSVFFFTIELF